MRRIVLIIGIVCFGMNARGERVYRYVDTPYGLQQQWVEVGHSRYVYERCEPDYSLVRVIFPPIFPIRVDFREHYNPPHPHYREHYNPHHYHNDRYRHR